LVAAAEPVEILPGLTVPVAAIGHLMALKTLAAAPERPQDAADLRALVRVADAGDLEVAREVLSLIEARGFARGKRLLEEFEQLASD
jgi:hypothetical protein